MDEWNHVPIRTKKFKIEIFSIDRPGETCVVSEVTGWETARVQSDSGAIDTVGPKGIAKPLTMKENVMSKKGLWCIAANGSKMRNHGGKRSSGIRRQETG